MLTSGSKSPQRFLNYAAFSHMLTAMKTVWLFLSYLFVVINERWRDEQLVPFTRSRTQMKYLFHKQCYQIYSFPIKSEFFEIQ